MSSAAFGILFNKVRWKAFELGSSLFDWFFWLVHLPVPGMVKNGQSLKKRIVFAGEMLPPRLPRIAKWLIKTGNFTTLLLCSKQGYVSKYEDPNFESVFLFRNKWHLKRILNQIPDIYVIHSFGPKSYFSNIIRQTTSAPFIHDMQDVLATYYGLHPDLRWLKQELPHEQACLEHSDGIISHSLEPVVAYRMYHTLKRPPTLFFPTYCDNEAFIDPVKIGKLSEGIHVVYVGGVAGSHRDPERYGSIQFQWLIELLTGQDIHFHIYPSPTNIRADYEEYEVLSKTNHLFHFHHSIPQAELSREISKYHFSILPFFSGQNIQTEHKYKYATAFKIFNYIEAGVPILVSSDMLFQSWLIERMEGGIRVNQADLSSLSSFMNEEGYSGIMAKLISGRKKMALDNQIQRMIRFYDHINSNKV